MTILAEIRSYLLAAATIAAAVGTRIRPRKLQQGETLPAIRLAIAGGNVHGHLGGMSGLHSARVQVDAVAATSQAADELAAAILARLGAHRQSTLVTKYCDEIVPDGEIRQHESPRADGGDSYDYFTSRDYLVTYQP
jgi:hypothetical protein